MLFGTGVPVYFVVTCDARAINAPGDILSRLQFQMVDLGSLSRADIMVGAGGGYPVVVDCLTQSRPCDRSLTTHITLLLVFRAGGHFTLDLRRVFLDCFVASCCCCRCCCRMIWSSLSNAPVDLVVQESISECLIIGLESASPLV